MDWQKRREVAARAEGTGGARGARPASKRRELAIRHDLSAGHGPKSACAVPEEPVRKDEWNVQEIVGLAVEKRLQTSRERLIHA